MNGPAGSMKLEGTMSAPQTNVEKQSKRHRPALVGIGAAAAFGVAILVALMVWAFATGDEPEGAELQVEPGVGVEEAAE